MADLLELERLCSVLPDRIEKAVNKLAVDTVKAIDRDLVQHTPVDTTLAVSNWQAGLNSAPNFELPAIAPGSGGSTASESRAEAIAHVDRTLADKKPGEAVYLTNVAPYIEDLNNGTSKQEPAGFVERAIRIGERFVANAKLELDK